MCSTKQLNVAFSDGRGPKMTFKNLYFGIHHTTQIRTDFFPPQIRELPAPYRTPKQSMKVRAEQSK